MLGVYDIEGYSRGRILWKGLKLAGADVDLLIPKHRTKYFAIAKRLLKKDFDVVVCTGKLVLWTAWLLKWWHRRQVIFDTFISDYDTLVLDRKLVKQGTLKSFFIWWGDKLAFKIADHTFFTENEQRDFCANEFKLDLSNCEEVFIGADNEIFKPLPKVKHDGFVVFFHGTFIPLQGIEYILRAAKRLESHKDIRFEIIGAGQTFPEMKALYDELKLTNVHLAGMKPITEVPKLLAAADIGLGLFGNTEKTQHVIPNKAFEITGCGMPLLTGDTPPLRRWLGPENAKFCKVADPEALANAILELKKNPAEREKLAKNGHQRYLETSTIEAVGKRLLSLIDEWTSSE